MYDLSFLENQNPYIIPYQTIGWWFDQGEQDNKEWNTSFQKFTAINQQALGATWLKGTVTVEVFSVTRERLIQTGSTNYKTYDFETSQGLYWVTHSRGVLLQKLASEKDTKMSQDDITNADIWHTNLDHWEKECIPQNFKKTYTIHMPRIGRGKVYRTTDYTDPKNWPYLLPGAQNTTKVLNKDSTKGCRILNNTENLSLESYTTPQDEFNVYSER